jgi:hypothetical protein
VCYPERKGARGSNTFWCSRSRAPSQSQPDIPLAGAQDAVRDHSPANPGRSTLVYRLVIRLIPGVCAFLDPLPNAILDSRYEAYKLLTARRYYLLQQKRID